VSALFRAIYRHLTPALQVRLAWFQLAVCLVGWPLSLWLIDEPKVILSLSWWAILATALDYIASSQANQKVSEE
jgi:hypothetical protein